MCNHTRIGAYALVRVVAHLLFKKVRATKILIIYKHYTH
nr:MAG TPA: hypothetical protein [Caudoviricetes sp.]